MNGLNALRAVFLCVVWLGMVVNVFEMWKAWTIRRNLIRARKNGLKQQSAENLVSSAKHRLSASLALVVILGVLFVAPPPRPPSYPYAAVVRLAFIWLACTVTAAGFAAQKGRKKTVRLIDAEIAKEEAATEDVL